MQITEMMAADVQRLADLDKICFAVPWSKNAFADELKNPNASYFVARDGDKIIGYGGFWRVLDEGQIMNIAVLPEYRRKGIATEILYEIIKAANDLQSIVLEVRESNTGAIALYEKFDFKAAGKRKRFYHSPVEDAIIMIRKHI